MPEISQRAFARHMGVALNAVQKAIKSGRIELTASKLIDQDVAERAWVRNTDDSRRSFEDQSRASRAVGADLPPDSGYEDEDDIPAVAGKEDPSLARYRAARAEREQVRLDTERMDLERKRGTTVALAEAQRLAFTVFRTVRDNVLNVPVRVKDILAAESDPLVIETLLEDELAKALASIDPMAVLREPDEEDVDGGDRGISEDDSGGDQA
ncbi:hypothetical protein [Burkholderia gladioli]|uniref:Terminase small subunit n=1 Tax=Burkholderia gladioli (strain BSR3) TaxID=999541 RepID=F2L9K2_BURGS|nr:hypothetical protein [Burkholderia gladioli]AEA59765.1 hypothetical protein bgla_1g10820 [Burkholderia gladioli BSR3]